MLPMSSLTPVVLAVVLCTAPTLFAQQQSSNASQQQKADAKQEKQDIVTDYSDPFRPKTTVVVTATRSEVSTEAAPASTSVVEQSELRTRNIHFLDQSLTLLQGMNINRGKGATDTLAGVGMRGFAGYGTGQSRVLVMLDGEPLNDAYTGVLTWQTLPVSEVERVEVARGPFSALYGGNAMGGVINILTQPVEKRRIEFSGQYGTWDTSMYSATYSDRFWQRLGLSLGYQRYQHGGYISRIVSTTATAGNTGIPVTGIIPSRTNTGALTYQVGDSGDNWWNQHAFRARGEYTFGSSTTAFFQYMRQQSEYGYDAYNSYARDAAGNPVYSGAVTFTDGGIARRLTMNAGSLLSGPGGGASNLFNGRVIHSFSSRQSIQVSGGVFDQPDNWYVTPASTANLVGGTGSLSARPNRSWHGNAQWSWAPSNRHSLIGGAEFRRESSSVGEFQLSNWALCDTQTAQTYAATGKAATQAVYGQDQISLTERLHIVAGGRIDYWKTQEGSSNTFGTPLVNEYPDRSQTSVNGKLAAVYSAGGGLTLRSSVGTAFRNPTVYNLYRTWRSSTGTTYQSNPTLEPEQLTSWEIGAMERISQRVEMEASYFENRVKNLIYLQADLVADPSGRTQTYFNAGRSRTRGLELAGKGQLLSWLQLRGSYTFNQSRILENLAIPDSVGKQVTYVPRHQATGLLLAARAKWTASLSGRYVGHAFGTDRNTDVVTGVPGSFDPYFVSAGTLAYAINQHVTVSVNADNLADRHYFQSSYSAPARAVYAGLRIRL
jgi:iron complex outermembrane receptor protein